MLEKCKKKKKGEVTVGVLLIMFITIVVGVALVVPVFQTQGTMINANSYATTSYALPAGETSVTDLTGQSLLSTAVVVNKTGSVNCATGKNISIQEGVSTTTGLKTVQLVRSGISPDCTSLNISYSYGANGYVDSAGGRAIAGTIGLFSVLALLGAIIFYYVKSEGLFGL